MIDHPTRDAGSDAASATGDLMQTAAGAVAGVVTEAARNFLPPSLLGEERPRYAAKSSGADGRRRSTKADASAKDDGKKKKKKKDD